MDIILPKKIVVCWFLYDRYAIIAWGFDSHGGTPIAGMVSFKEIPISKWMMTRGTAIYGNIPMDNNGFDNPPGFILMDILWILVN